MLLFSWEKHLTNGGGDAKLILCAEEGGVFDDTVELCVTSVSVALAICSAIWSLMENKTRRLNRLTLFWHHLRISNLLCGSRKYSYPPPPHMEGFLICISPTTTTLPPLPWIFHWPTGRGIIMGIFSNCTCLQKPAGTRSIECSIDMHCSLKYTCYLASAIRLNVPCTPGTQGKTPSSWSYDTLDNAGVKWSLCTMTCGLKVTTETSLNRTWVLLNLLIIDIFQNWLSIYLLELFM